MWTMHLSLLPNPPNAEPLDYLRDTATPKDSASASPAVQEGATLRKETQEDAPEDNTDDEDIVDRQEGQNNEEHSSSSSSSESESEEDAELSRMMHEPSDLSSSSDQSSKESKPQFAASKKKRLHDLYGSPAGNISVLIVSCWTFRLPITYMDFVRFVHASQLLSIISVKYSLGW